MDPPLNPPVRIIPVAATPLSGKQAEKQLDAFIEDFQLRGSASAGTGNGAATVQLRKLKEALKEERKKAKEAALRNREPVDAVVHPSTTAAMRGPSTAYAKRLLTNPSAFLNTPASKLGWALHTITTFS